MLMQMFYRTAGGQALPGTFTPTAKITREDMAVMVMRYVEYKDIKLAESGQQVASGELKAAFRLRAAQSAVAATQSAGIINGNPDGIFAPKDNATRAQAAKIFAMLQQSSGNHAG